MLCLDAKVKELEKEIDGLKDRIGENKAWISNLAQIPLRRKMSLVLLNLKDNRKCAQLMRCVEKDKSKVQTCQEEAQQLTSHCDVTAFVAKILDGNNYYFLREVPTLLIKLLQLKWRRKRSGNSREILWDSIRRCSYP